jgi:hypothetical protein
MGHSRATPHGRSAGRHHRGPSTLTLGRHVELDHVQIESPPKPRSPIGALTTIRSKSGFFTQILLEAILVRPGIVE